MEAYSQQSRVSLHLSNVSVEEVLNELESKSDYFFFFNQKLVDINRKVDIMADSLTIDAVLAELFKESEVSYIIYDRQIILAPVNVIKSFSKDQMKITGTVMDAISGAPVYGAYVVVEGSFAGTVTDVNGNYTLQTPDQNAVLLYSFVGYFTRRVTYFGQERIDVKMDPDLHGLEEIVVIGYGTQVKDIITGSISSLKSENIQPSSVAFAEQVIQGNMAGVQVISNSGAPGAGIKVRIRGYSSNGSSDPLYIIDGIRSSSIRNINPNDISSIEVLKDASSSAIYGAEGGNGVILISTKKGSAGKERISYSVLYGWQTLANEPEVMNAEQFVTYMKEARYLDNAPTNINTNWIDEIFVTSPFQNHHLSFSGGSQKGTFFMSLSYLNQDGIVKGASDKFERYTLMFNSDYNISKWLKVGHNISLAHTDLNTVSENAEFGNLISNAIMFDPLTPVFYDGALPSHVQSFLDEGKKLMQNENGKYYGISEYANGEIINPFVNRDLSKSTAQNDNLFGNLFLNITPFKNLVYTSRLGFNVVASNSHTYNPQYYFNSTRFNDVSTVSDMNTIGRYWQLENFFTYSNRVGSHNFTLLAGMSSSENRSRLLSASGGPLSKDQESYADLSYIESQLSDQVSGYLGVSRKVSYFARLAYDFKSKYIVQASLRRDAAGLDILPKENRWGTFPSVSLGWIISDEKFFPESSFIDNIKLRASWGQNGSLSNLGNYQYSSSLISTGVYPILENTFYTATWPGRLSNTDLTWETSEQTDFGLDLRLFNDGLKFTMDYFNKETRNLITTNTPPLEAGNIASPVNAGNVINKGFEFVLEYTGKINNWNFTVSPNISTLTNKVTYLNPTITRLNGAIVNRWTATAFEKGLPIWYFRGYRSTGISPVTGDPNFEDIDGVPGITEGDKTYIGSSIPKITYGSNFYLEHKGFDFNLLLQGQAGCDILMGMVRTDRPINNKLTVFYYDRWTPENINASMPRAGTDARSFNSDLLVFDGSYLRLKQIQLGYRLPSSLLQKIGCETFRIYLLLEDIYTFTKYPGMNPDGGSADNNSIGIDRGMFPVARKITFGTSVTF